MATAKVQKGSSALMGGNQGTSLGFGTGSQPSGHGGGYSSMPASAPQVLGGPMAGGATLGGPISGGGSSSSSSSLTSALQGLAGGGSQAPAASYNPSEFTSQVQQNPQLAALGADYATYQGQLAGNTDLEATQAMQRERDLTSGMAKEFGSDLAARGILGSGAGVQDLQNRIIEPGAQRATQANVALTNAGRDKQLAALGGRTGVANAQAQAQQAQQNFGLSAWQAAEQQKLASAQLQAMQRNQGLQNLQSVVGLMGSLYSGF